MNRPEAVVKSVTYTRKLLEAGVSGVRAGQLTAGNGRSLSSIVAESARDSIAIAAVGACAGLVRSYLSRRRGHASNRLACGALGTAVGFCAGFVWTTRTVTSSLAHAALQEIHKTSDERWLALHPIDYA